LISADTNVSKTGTLVYAYHFTQDSEANVAVNGVNFAAFSLSFSHDNLSLPVTKGNVTASPGTGGVLDAKDTVAGWSSGTFTTLSSAYQSLVGGGVSDLSKQFSFTLSGLTPGQTYQLQLWSSCSSDMGYFFNTPSHNVKNQISAGNSVTLDVNNTNTPGGVGQWVIGTFTADATTETISISNSATNDGPVLNAFQLRLVPEPCAGLLLSGSGLFFATLRRRKARC